MGARPASLVRDQLLISDEKTLIGSTRQFGAQRAAFSCDGEPYGTVRVPALAGA